MAHFDAAERRPLHVPAGLGAAPRTIGTSRLPAQGETDPSRSPNDGWVALRAFGLLVGGMAALSYLIFVL